MLAHPGEGGLRPSSTPSLDGLRYAPAPLRAALQVAYGRLRLWLRLRPRGAARR